MKLEYIAEGIYKKVPEKSKGLGDTIEKITQVTGIKWVVDKISEITGKPCGCPERKEVLNNKFAYKK